MSKNYRDDIYWEMGNPEVNVFRHYLQTMEEFLSNEKQEHTRSMTEISDKIKSGDISPPDDLGQFPPELEYDYYSLAAMDSFANILRKSFFVSLYSFLEAGLMRRCRRLERRNNSLLSITDIAGRGINQAMTYLIKVCHVNFSLSTSSEWNEIQNYRKLRNWIVHNEGGLDERAEQHRNLEAYVNRKPNLSLSTGYAKEIILSQDFCVEVIETVAAFLYAVDSAIQPRETNIQQGK